MNLRHCEQLLASGNSSLVKDLLDDDTQLQYEFNQQSSICSATLDHITEIADMYSDLQTLLPGGQSTSSEIYALAVSGRLLDSDNTKDLLAALRKLPSKYSTIVLETLSRVLILQEAILPISDAYNLFLRELPEEQRMSLKSGNGVQHQNMRTTVVAHRVELSQQNSNLTKSERDYTDFLDRIHDTLAAYLSRYLCNPQDMFPIEVLVYDQLVPYRDVFNPQSRAVIERSLHECHDYLGNEFCADDHQDCSRLQPATSVLYRLYLECGGLISVADLWSAFCTIMKPEISKNSDEEEEQTLCLFETALAELKYLNLIRQSRKKIDSVSKLSWKDI